MSELQKLANLLFTSKIPYEVKIHPFFDAPIIKYPNYEHCVCSVICHQYSYGGKEGLLEIMGLVKTDYDDVEGRLTANEVYNRIYEDWNNNCGA